MAADGMSLGEINDLPGMDELKAAGLIGGRPAVSLRESALTPAEAMDEQDADEAPAPELEPLLQEEALSPQR